ncbi:MAG: zinc ribbon domain-containing protein [Chlamydiales bacterium]|nr:zinc ribbon domain-containing protein [Chlamydiales bacterium]
MPTYDYICDHCHKKTEVSQKITAEPLKRCPDCLQDTLRRGIGGGLATLRFEGSGFYITDYANKDSREPSSQKSEDNGSYGCNKTACK